MKSVCIVQNCEPEPPGTIIDYLSQRGLSRILVRSYADDPYPDYADISALMVMGCPLSVTTYRDHPFLVRLYDYIAGALRQDLPYLGICFGGQILARALGAAVGPNPVKEVGSAPVRLTAAGQEDPLFFGFPTEFPVMQWHGDTFKTPFASAHLAASDLCANQAFRRGKQVGLQFHLEATAADVARWCSTYPEDLAQSGRNADQVLAAFADTQEQINKLNHQLLDNFFRIAANHT